MKKFYCLESTSMAPSGGAVLSSSGAYTHTHTHTRFRKNKPVLFLILMAMFMSFNLSAQDRDCDYILGYSWTYYLTVIDEFYEDNVSLLLNDNHLFNQQSPQVVYELPQMKRCDCVFSMGITCSATYNTDFEIYDENFQYLFTFEDTDQNSFTPTGECYDYPSDGVYYIKIRLYANGILA